MKRIVFSGLLAFMCMPALAANTNTKILVCHVGSQLGSNDESYQANRDCTIPDEWSGEEADYICPDAGKVDLILVSEKASHVGNDSHAFTEPGTPPFEWVDYLPGGGVGDDPADFEEGSVPGIDRGCELADEKLSCECWNDHTEDELVALMNIAGTPMPYADCGVGNGFAYARAGETPGGIQVQLTADDQRPGATYCWMNAPDPYNISRVGNNATTVTACVDELTAIVPRISWCQ